MNALERALAGGVEVPNSAYNSKSKRGRLQPKTIISTDYTKDPSLQMARAFTRNASPIQYNLNEYNNQPFERYDTYINPIDTRQELEYERAKNQSWLEQTGRAINQVGGEFILGTLRSFVDIGDYVYQKASGENDYTSELGESLRKAQEEWNKNNEIYQLEPGRFNLLDWGYVMSNMVSVGNVLSLAIPGVGLAKGVGLLGKALRVNKALSKITKFAATAGRTAGQGLRFNPYRVDKTIGNVTDLMLSAGISRIGENYMEAHDTYDNVYNNSLENLNNMTDEERAEFDRRNPEFKGKSNEEIAKNIAGESADDVFTKDMWLMAFDMMQLRGVSKMWKGASKMVSTKATREAQEAAVRTITGEATVPISRFKRFKRGLGDFNYREYAEALTEAPEEMWQSATQQMAIQEAQDRFKYNPNKKDYLDFLTNDDALEAGFWGVMAGLVFKGASEGVGKLVNTLQDVNYKRKHKDELNNYNHRRQESIFDDYRTYEINSRPAAYQQLSNDLKLIEEGYDPDTPIRDRNGMLIRDENGNPLYNEIPTEDIQRKKEERIREFVTTLTMNAYDRGNITSLKEFFKQADVKQFLEKNDVNIQDINEVDAIIQDQMNKVERMYDYELNKVANNTVDDTSVRMIARNNILNRLDSERLRKESDNWLATYNELLNKVTNEETKKNLTVANDKIKAQVYSNEYNLINERIKRLKEARGKRKDRMGFAQYTEELDRLNKRKRLIETTYLGETTYDNTTSRRFKEKIKADRNNAMVNMARLTDKDVVSAYEEYIKNDIYSKYRASDVLETSNDIYNESVKEANNNEKFIEQEHKRAVKQLNDIIEDSSIDINELDKYFTNLLNRNREGISSANLTRAQKSRINRAVRDFNIFNTTNAPISEYIGRRILRESIKRRESAGRTVDVTTGKTVVSTPSPTGGQTQTTSSTTNTDTTRLPVKESPEDKEAQATDVGRTPEEQPTSEEERALEEEAKANKERLEKIKNAENAVKKSIEEYINKVSDLNTAFSNENIATTKEDIKAYCLNSNPDLNDTINSLVDDDMTLIGYIVEKAPSLEDAMNIDYVKNFFGENTRSSTIVIAALKVINDNSDGIDYKAIKELLDKYTEAYNIISGTQTYFLNIDNLVKFIIKQMDNSKLLSTEQVKRLYNKTARALNNQVELNKYGNPNIKFDFRRAHLGILTDKDATKLYQTAILEKDSGINQRSISSAIDDRRINIRSDISIQSGQAIYYQLAVDKSGNPTGVSFYIINNNNAIPIGTNTIAKRPNNDNYNNTFYTSFNYDTKIYVRFSKSEQNGLDVFSTFDELIQEFFPIETEGEFVGDNKPRSKEASEAYNLLMELYGKLHEDGYIITEEDINKIYNNKFLVEKGRLNDTNVYGNAMKMSKAIALAQFLNDTIIKYKNSDSNMIMLNSYENYKRRMYSNYEFTEELVNKAKQYKAIKGKKGAPFNFRPECTLIVATSSEGQLNIDNSPESESGTLRDRLVDFDSKVDKGEISLMYLDNTNTMHFSNTPRTFMIPGYSNKANLLLSVSNGDKMPTFVALEPELVNPNDEGLGEAIRDEMINLITRFQTDNNYTLQNLKEDLSQIIGYKNLINLAFSEVNGNKLIISLTGRGLADLEIGNVDGSGNKQVRFKANINPKTNEPFVEDHVSKETLKEQLDNIISKATYALSFDYSRYGEKLNNKYVNKDDKEFTVNIGGKTFNSDNYLKFIADNDIALTPIYKTKYGNVETNFKTVGTVAGGNRNVQVLNPSITDKKVISSNVLRNKYNNFIDSFTKGKDGTYIETKKFIDEFAPTFKEVKQFKFGAIRMQDRIYYDEDYQGEGHAYFNENENRIYITKKGVDLIKDKAAYNTTRAEEEIVRLLIHENLHRIYNNTKTGNVIRNNVEKLLPELNQIATILNELSDNDIQTLSNRFNIDARQAINALLDVSGYNRDTKSFDTKTAEGRIGIEEFIVETMTRPQYINILNSVETTDTETNQKKTIWDRFIEWIAKIFNIDINERSLFKKEINAISNLYRHDRPPVGGVSQPVTTDTSNEVVEGTNDNPKVDKEEKQKQAAETPEVQEPTEPVSTEQAPTTKAPAEPAGRPPIKNRSERGRSLREQRRRRKEDNDDDYISTKLSTIDVRLNKSSINVPSISSLASSVSVEDRSNLVDSVFTGELKMRC